MRRSYKLIQYLPLPEAEMMMNHSVSDLHLVMDLVNQNGHAKNVSELLGLIFFVKMG
jgi:hypothetical protein